MNQKKQWLRNQLLSLNLQGMIVSNPVNIRYLTNIQAEGILLVTRKENLFITDSRYIEDVHNTLTLFDEIVVYDARGLTKEDYENFFMFCENVGFEENYITYAKYKEYMHRYKVNCLVETENMIEKQRMIKDEEEIENIKEACRITDECFNHIVDYIRPGMTEKQIAREIDYFYYKHSEGLSFDTIVASGENSSKPHAIPSDRKIQKNDIITIDMGCKVKGYCSDMTRTIFVGEVQEEMKKVYELVLKNQEQVLQDMRDGANTKQISKMVDNDFRLHNFDLIHALGHGVGLDIHEGPVLSINSEHTLKEKMIVTDEPGIYIPGQFGVRIEDTVQIFKGSCEPLTKSPKKIIVIK